MTKITRRADPRTGEYFPVVAGPRERLQSLWEWLQNIFNIVKSRINKITRVQALMFIAFVLRLFQLGKGAYWYDEGVSIVFARLPWSNMIQATAGDVHPPGYYVILWLLARTGIPLTESVARFPSLLFSMGAVYMTWKLVNRAELNLTPMGKYFIIGWVIISPLQLHYAQETRMYSMLQLEVLLGIWFIVERRRALLSLVMASMLYTQNYAVFYLPTFALTALVTDYVYVFDIKTSIMLFVKKWAGWFVAPVLLWVPWFIVLMGQMGTVSEGYWIQPVKLPSIIFALYQMLFAYSMPPTFQGLGVMLTCGVLIYTAWRIYNDQPHYWLPLVILAFGPFALSVFVSWIWKPVLLFRGLIGTAIPLTILVVKAIEGISYKYKQIYAYTLIGVTLLAGLYGHYAYNAENKGTTTTWVHEVVESMENGDVVLSLNDNGIIAMKTYAPGIPLFKLEGCGAEPLGSLSPATRTAIGIEERSIDQLIPGNAGIWEPLQVYNRIYFISTIAPVSPACEIAVANEIISGGNVTLIQELANDEYAQAGIYLITTGEIY